MKAIRKGDGKEVDVILFHDKEYIDVLPSEHDCRQIYPAETLVVDEVVDWQAFRREAAKEMLPITSNWKLTKAGGTASISISKEAACKLAISYADELIKQLKEK